MSFATVVRFTAGTYNGSSFNMAAALATIETLAAQSPYPGMMQHGQAIREQFEALAKARGLPLVTSGVGSVFSAHFGLSEPPRNYADTLKIDNRHLPTLSTGTT